MERFEKIQVYEDDIALNQVFVSQENVNFDDLYCEVCDIEFGNVSMKQKHSKSRKHKDNFEILKRLMKQQDDDLKKDGLKEDDLDLDNEVNKNEEIESELKNEEENDDKENIDQKINNDEKSNNFDYKKNRNRIKNMKKHNLISDNI